MARARALLALIGRTLQRWGRNLLAVGAAIWQFVRDSFFARLVRLAWRTPLRLFPVGALLGGLALGCAAGAFATGHSILDARLAAGAWTFAAWLTAIFAGLLLLELSAAAALALVETWLTLAREFGRRVIGTLTAALAFLLAVGAGAELTRQPGTAWTFYGVPVLPVLAIVAILFSLWFHRVYLRPLARGFRDYRWDLACGQSALTELSHGR